MEFGTTACNSGPVGSSPWNIDIALECCCNGKGLEAVNGEEENSLWKCEYETRTERPEAGGYFYVTMAIGLYIFQQS